MFIGMEQFAITERAAARIAEIVAAEGRDAALRVLQSLPETGFGPDAD